MTLFHYLSVVIDLNANAVRKLIFLKFPLFARRIAVNSSAKSAASDSLVGLLLSIHIDSSESSENDWLKRSGSINCCNVSKSVTFDLNNYLSNAPLILKECSANESL